LPKVASLAVHLGDLWADSSDVLSAVKLVVVSVSPKVPSLVSASDRSKARELDPGSARARVRERAKVRMQWACSKGKLLCSHL